MSVGTLHDIGCEGPADCHCAVVYGVRETGSGEQANGYTSTSRVELQSDRIQREASAVLNPLLAPRTVHRG